MNGQGAALAAFVALALYLSALHNAFVWDDIIYVEDNNYICLLDSAFFKGAFFSFYAANFAP